MFLFIQIYFWKTLFCLFCVRYHKTTLFYTSLHGSPPFQHLRR